MTAAGAPARPSVPARPFIEAFQEVCERNPSHTAIDDNGREISYGQLWQATLALAARLRELGAGPGSRVAVHEERSAAAVTAYLGALYVGACFVPVDVDLPEQRKTQILRDSAPSLVLGRPVPTDPAAGLSGDVSAGLPVVHLDGAMAGGGADGSGSGSGSGVGTGGAEGSGSAGGIGGVGSAVSVSEPYWRGPGDHPAYLLYTSGTTGLPKGAVLLRGGIDYMAETCAALFSITPADRVAQVSALSFDASVFEIFLALRAGATLVVVGRRRFGSIQEMVDLVDRTACTAALITPTALASSGDRALPRLRLLMAGGERLTPQLARRWSSGRRLYNLYGPTECTVLIGSHLFDAEREYGLSSVPIGGPMPGYRWSLRRADGSPAPDGLGELWAAGPGVAAGYLDRPQETARAFAADPDGTVWYRTGDLVRQVGEDEYEYQGRVDDQVKIRGFRIELAEVERAAQTLPWIRTAAALPVRDTGSVPDYLALCFVAAARADHAAAARADHAAAAGDDPAAEIRAYLRARLPHYMVPARVLELDALPVNSSGKVDRAALAALFAQSPDTEPEHAGARPADRLTRTWDDLLGSADPDENFFALGGDSLIAAELMAVFEQSTGRRAPAHLVNRTFTLRTLLDAADAESETVAEDEGDLPRVMAGVTATDTPGVTTGATAAQPPQEPSGAPPTPTPVSFAQQARLGREWSAAAGHRVIPVILAVDGELDLGRLREAVGEVADRHPALRTAFGRDHSGAFFQRTRPRLAPDVTDEPLSRAEMDQLLAGTFTVLSADLRRPFPFDGDGFLRAAHAHDGDRHAIVLTTEHLVFDGWSLRILLEDLAAAYAGKAIAAPGRTTADLAAAARAPEQARERGRRIAHWRATLSGRPLAPYFTPSWPAGSGGSRLGVFAADLPPGSAARARRRAADLRVSLHTYLLAATAGWLEALSPGTDNGLLVTYHGRQTPAERAVVGDFAEVLSLRVPASAADGPEALAVAADGAMHAAQTHFVPYSALRAAVAPDEPLHDVLSFELRSPRYFEFSTVLPDGSRWRFVDPRDVDPPFGGAKVLFDDFGDVLRLVLRHDAGRFDAQAVAEGARDLAALVERWGRG